MKKKKQIKILREELISANAWATHYHHQAERAHEGQEITRKNFEKLSATTENLAQWVINMRTAINQQLAYHENFPPQGSARYMAMQAQLEQARWAVDYKPDPKKLPPCDCNYCINFRNVLTPPRRDDESNSG